MALITKTVTISGGNATGLSTQVSIGGDIVGISIPAGWTPAAISFLNSFDQGATFLDVSSLGSEIAINAQVGYNAIPPGFLPGIAQLIIRSGILGAPVTQTADRVITISIQTS